jgi:hypothetical protein
MQARRKRVSKARITAEKVNDANNLEKAVKEHIDEAKDIGIALEVMKTSQFVQRYRIEPPNRQLRYVPLR